jgi:glycine oxidase
MKRQRIAVVGGGVIGLACAWRLADDGHAVLLFDGAPEAREASWAAAGMLAPHHEATAADAVWRLGCASLSRWRDFAQRLNTDIDLHLDGGLLPLMTEADAATIEEKRAFAESQGIATQWLSRAELAAREPQLAARGALLVPGGHVDPRRLTAALRQGCLQRGVELRYGTAVTGLCPGGVRTSTGSGSIETCDLTVLANGAWTPALAQLAGISVDGEPVKGQLLRFAVEDGLLRHFVHCHHAYLVPRAGAGLVVGSTMVWSGFDKSEDAAAIAHLAANARRLLPQLADAAIV